MFINITDENRIYYIVGVSILFLVLYYYFTNGVEHLTPTARTLKKVSTPPPYNEELLKSIALVQFEKYHTPLMQKKFKPYIYNFKELIKAIDKEIKIGSLLASTKKDKSYINMVSSKMTGSGPVPKTVVDAIVIHKFKDHMNIKNNKGRYYVKHLNAYKANICDIINKLIDEKKLDKDVKYDSIYKHNCSI